MSAEPQFKSSKLSPLGLTNSCELLRLQERKWKSAVFVLREKWALTWQNETEGGWFEEEDHAFAERHGDTDGAHHHHGETQQGQDSCCQIQICEEEQKQHLYTEGEKTIKNVAPSLILEPFCWDFTRFQFTYRANSTNRDFTCAIFHTGLTKKRLLAYFFFF